MILNYWQNLNERERWMAILGSAFLLAYLFYLALYSPLTRAVHNKQEQLREKQATLTWMKQVKQQAKTHKTTAAISNAKLLALIGHQLSSNSLQKNVYQLQQTGAGDIQLSFERVPYTLFLNWLWTLSTDYAINLKQFTADRSDALGVVKLLIVISAK